MQIACSPRHSSPLIHNCSAFGCRSNWWRDVIIPEGSFSCAKWKKCWVAWLKCKIISWSVKGQSVRVCSNYDFIAYNLQVWNAQCKRSASEELVSKWVSAKRSRVYLIVSIRKCSSVSVKASQCLAFHIKFFKCNKVKCANAVLCSSSSRPSSSFLGYGNLFADNRNNIPSGLTPWTFGLLAPLLPHVI